MAGSLLYIVYVIVRCGWITPIYSICNSEVWLDHCLCLHKFDHLLYVSDFVLSRVVGAADMMY